MTNSNDTDESAALRNRLELIKAKVERIRDYVDSFADHDDIEQLVLRKASLEQSLPKFEEIYYQLTRLKAADETEAEQFECGYFDLVAKINKFLNKRNTVTPVQAGTKNNVNLPSLKLPTFSGAYHEWLSFYDSFTNLVHKDERLTDCQKFYYLKACLTGEALRAVESLAVSNANYQSAYTILESRFKNERLIVQDHVYSILNFAPITKSSDTSLRQLLDNLTINLEALKSLQVPVAQWDDILVPIINTKLDYTTKKEWETTQGKERSKLDDLKLFLEKRCQFIESINAAQKVNQNAGMNKISYNYKKISGAYCNPSK